MRSIVLGLAIAGALTGCIVRNIVRGDAPRLTGTCAGACEHYVTCKPGHPAAAAARCTAECPDVMTDPDSLMMFESLSCQDAVEFVDGTGTAATAHK